MAYHYRLQSTGKSSSHFGPCEVCDQHVSEVFIQVESRDFTCDGETRQTYYQCRSHAFGHKDCLHSLVRQQREANQRELDEARKALAEMETGQMNKNFKHFTVISTLSGEIIGSVRAKDHQSAMELAIAIYGNYFSDDKGVRLA